MKFEELKPEDLEGRTQEQAAEAQAAKAERLRQLEEAASKLKDNKQERVETARANIEEAAKAPEHRPVPRAETTENKLTVNEAKNRAYVVALSEIRAHLSQREKRFSKIIHSPKIEKISEITARTIARPSLTLGAASFAFLGGTLLYLAARRYGFSLSGTEFLAASILGGLAGITGEGIWQLFKRMASQA